MKKMTVHAIGWFYRNVAVHIFFLWDSEPIHDFFLDMGECMAHIPGIPALISLMCRFEDERLTTTVAGITFPNPIGLAAGFDHEAQLPSMVHAIGFGFESVGTITNGAYGGNEYPRIKRMVKSRSILVNKGLKSSGIRAVITRVAARHIRWRVPVGISVGQTNSQTITTHEEAIGDIVSALTFIREYQLPFSYIELNISCPNLNHDISFYDPNRLDQLLSAVEKIGLTVPLFLKMPISLSNDETMQLFTVCLRHRIAAVIIGNLQHNRADPAFNPGEIAACEGKRGNFSGKPCQSRSDELIKLAYPILKNNIAIIGCGGVFNAEDAYRKIRNGASLIQLATATIFEGPQVAGEINADLIHILKRDGYFSVSSAVGVNVPS